MLRYKGYTARVQFDDEESLFHGEVLHLKDLVTFQGRSVDEIEPIFRDSVDEYQEYCSIRGEEPDKPFTGRFMLGRRPSLSQSHTCERKERGKLRQVLGPGTSSRAAAELSASPPE